MSELSQRHQAFCDHAELFKGNTPRTISWFRETFRYFLIDTHATGLDQITRELIEAYVIQGRRHKDWAPRTIRARLSALKSFLDWGYLDWNPAADIPLPKLDQ